MPWWRCNCKSSLFIQLHQQFLITRRRLTTNHHSNTNFFFHIHQQQPQTLPFSTTTVSTSKLAKLTHKNVLSTLKKTRCDFLCLTLFLWCARQPRFFHDPHAFHHMTHVLPRLLQQQPDHPDSPLNALLQRLLIKPQTLLLLLRIFWHGSMFDLVFQLFDEMPNYGFTPDTYSRNILIDSLFKTGLVDVALQVFRDSPKPNVLTFSIVVCNLCELGGCDSGNIREVLRTMLRRRYYLSERTFSVVLRRFCKSGRMANALQILGLMISMGIPLRVDTWSILIDGFCKASDLVTAEYLFERMMESGCSPNVVTYSCLISGLFKSQMPDRALRILSTMESNGCAPNLVLCNVLIRSLSKLGMYEDAFDVYFSLPKRNLVPNSYTFCSLISAVCLSRQYDLLPLLINGVCVNIDLVIANSLLTYFCKAGYPSGAVDLYNDMIYRGFVPDKYTYAGLLTGLCGTGRVDEAVNVYNAIVGNGFCVDPHIHTVMVHGLVNSGNLHRAIRLFRKAVQQRYPLDVVSYTAAIQGLVRSGAIQEASELFMQMMEDGVAPNAYTYNLMLSGFCRVGDVIMVREILNEMAHEGFVLNCRTVYMVKGLFRSCCLHSNISLFNEMCHSDSISDKALGALLLKTFIDCVHLGGDLVTVPNVDFPGSDEMSDVAVAVG